LRKLDAYRIIGVDYDHGLGRKGESVRRIPLGDLVNASFTAAALTPAGTAA
jgi:hypothetical protein